MIVLASRALVAFSLLVVLANLRVVEVAVFTFGARPVKVILAQRHHGFARWRGASPIGCRRIIVWTLATSEKT